MQLNSRFGVLMAALAGISLGTAMTAFADSGADASSSSASAVPHHHHWHRRPMMGGPLGMTLRAAHQLSLTDDQKAQIRTILQTARTQARATLQAGSIDMAVLGNPADPNYATELQTLKENAANRIQMESELQSQIYNVLTTQQKEQLPTVLAAMKAKAEQRRAEWQQRHASS